MRTKQLSIAQAWASIAMAYEQVITQRRRPRSDEHLARYGFCSAVDNLRNRDAINWSTAARMEGQIDALLKERAESEGIWRPLYLARYNLEGARFRATLAWFLAHAYREAK